MALLHFLHSPKLCLILRTSQRYDLPITSAMLASVERPANISEALEALEGPRIDVWRSERGEKYSHDSIQLCTMGELHDQVRCPGSSLLVPRARLSEEGSLGDADLRCSQSRAVQNQAGHCGAHKASSTNSTSPTVDQAEARRGGQGQESGAEAALAPWSRASSSLPRTPGSPAPFGLASACTSPSWP